MSRLVRFVLMAFIAMGVAQPWVFGQESKRGEQEVAPHRQRSEFPEERRRRINAALGRTPPPPGALSASTVAANPSPQALPSADIVLSIDGDFDLGRYIFQNGTPFIHSHGGADYANTAVGHDALTSATPGTPDYYFGAHNTAVGLEAATNTTSGRLNVALGANALAYNTTGISNTAVGAYAGTGWPSNGMDNIALGSGAYGEMADTGTTRIGGEDRQARVFIEGIHGATATGGIPVVINSDDRLGTSTSSARFKQDIRDLEGVSDKLLDLRPVVFRYKDELAEGGPNPLEYGLIAEEVAEVFPELVVNDAEGRPYTVRYHLLAPLLLHELQREVARSEQRDAEVEDLRRQVADLRRLVVNLRP